MSGHPLTWPIYTAPRPPKSCGTCNKGKHHMERVYARESGYECSHAACPHRSRVTAQPRQ